MGHGTCCIRFFRPLGILSNIAQEPRGLAQIAAHHIDHMSGKDISALGFFDLPCGLTLGYHH